jgi:hypothetical protein
MVGVMLTVGDPTVFVNQQKSRLLFNCRLGTVSYMVGVLLTVGDPTVCKSTEVKITVHL